MDFVAINPHKLNWKIGAEQHPDGALEVADWADGGPWYNKPATTKNYPLQLPNFIFYATFDVPMVPWGSMRNLATPEKHYNIHAETHGKILYALGDNNGGMQVLPNDDPQQTLVKGYWTFMRRNRVYYPIPLGFIPDDDLHIKGEEEKQKYGIR